MSDLEKIEASSQNEQITQDNNEQSTDPKSKFETQRKSQWNKILNLNFPQVRKLAYKYDGIIRVYKNYFEKAQEVAKSSFPDEERRRLISIQEEEFKNLLNAVSESSAPEDELNEKDELFFLRADQSQLKFQLSQKDDLIKDLQEQFNKGFAKNKINDKKTSYASKANNYKKENNYKTQGNKAEQKSFDKHKQKHKTNPTAICNRCKREGHYANNCYANLNKVNSLNVCNDPEEKIYVVYLDNSGPKNICSIKGLVDNKLMKIGLDCGATNSIMNHMTAMNNNIEILRSELKIRTANGIVSEISGITRPLEVNISGHKCNMQFLVFDHEDHDVLLGLDWFKKTGCGIF
ncbi:unnamed protein product, partial [Brachionus calyciflorus]